MTPWGGGGGGSIIHLVNQPINTLELERVASLRP
jgi:hypothetical protein